MQRSSFVETVTGSALKWTNLTDESIVSICLLFLHATSDVVEARHG